MVIGSAGGIVASELALGPGSGITLEAVATGPIRTPMNAKEHEKAILAMRDACPIPAGRAGTADEIEGLFGYLLSAEAGFRCGTVTFIDGGTEAASRGAE